MLSFLPDVGWGLVMMFFISYWSSGDCSGFKACARYRMKRSADTQSPCGTPVFVIISSPSSSSIFTWSLTSSVSIVLNCVVHFDLEFLIVLQIASFRSLCQKLCSCQASKD